MRKLRYFAPPFVVFLWIAGVSGREAKAQGCQPTYTLNYETYSTSSTDGTYLYTSVTTDGTATMSPVPPGCPAWTAKHTPYAYNKLGTVGGNLAGNSACPSCYISVTNSQDVIATQGVEYEFDEGGTVICTLGGTVFSFSSTSFLSIHRTTYKYASIANNVCTYNVYCITSPHICGGDVTTVQAPCSQTYLITAWIKVRVGTSSACFPGLGPSGVLSNTWLACF